MFVLYGKPTSINVRKVLWLCAELDLPFSHDPAPAPDVLSTLNPNRQVPVLRDGDFVLWESNTIIRYLAGQYQGHHLYPAEPKLRARVDQWMDWQATDLNRSWSYAFMALARQSPAHRDEGAIEASCRDWARFMGILDQRLAATGAYVAGDAFTLADIPVGLSVNRWFETPFDKPALPAVAAYYDKLAQRDGYRQYGRNGTA